MTHQHKYEVVLKDKDDTDKFVGIDIDEYSLDFIVHAFTGMTELNLFCVIHDDSGQISDAPECQAFTIPWDNILYIHQFHGLKATLDKANEKVKKDGDTFNKVLAEHKMKAEKDMSIG